MYAEVILAKASPFLDRTFDYAVPGKLETSVKVGLQVLVPFGSRSEVGYITSLKEKSAIKNVKEIIEVRGRFPYFSEKQVELAQWVSKYYFSFFVRALRSMMPPGMRQKEKNKTARTKSVITKEPPVEEAVQESLPMLTPHQQDAFDKVKQSIDANASRTYLLFGVTGSGKTEVYLRLIDYCLQKKRRAIVLVPEIGLTPQMLERFRERFKSAIAILHSSMTIGERKAEWERIASGEAKIVLGTRMAIFAPVKNLGIIVVDEEYEITYKQDQHPHYHARKVAQYLSERDGIPLVLGSATPAVESFYAAENGKYQMLELPNRIDNRKLPPVEIVDMKNEPEKGNMGVISLRLRAELKKVFAQKQQAILFLNRRGYFTYALCRSCANIVKCPDCSVSLLFNKNNSKLNCGHCGFSIRAPIVCPRCQGTAISYFGSGTQRLEGELKDNFPQARIARLDSDSIKEKGKSAQVYRDFRLGKIDLLIGTQLVSKGIDVENVTLIGVVSADTSLSLPDFRSAETTFQQLTQVAGRAGRGGLPGKVIIQTFQPKHYATVAASLHDYRSFYEKEIVSRRELRFPPFSELMHIIISSRDKEKAENCAGIIKEMLIKAAKDKSAIEVLGPAQSAIAKIRGEYRFSILIKSTENNETAILVEDVLSKMLKSSGVKINIDVDPVFLA